MCTRWNKLGLLGALLVLLVRPAVMASPPSPWLASFQDLLAEADAKQSGGYDISPAMPYLTGVQAALKQGATNAALDFLAGASNVISRLPVPEALPTGVTVVAVSAAAPGAPVPPLAGDIVLQEPRNGDPRWERFAGEIGPDLIQMKLFLNDLDAAHGNYRFLQHSNDWLTAVREVHDAGGKVMLHLRNIPARLSAFPEYNGPFDGKGPLKDAAAEAEWRQIVRETIQFFLQNGARLDAVQCIGEPNIGTNWIDSQNPTNARPNNAVEFARFFELTEQAAHAVDPLVRVGGPTLWFSSNDDLWWDGFLGYASNRNVRLDFVTTHIYEINFGIWDAGVAKTKAKMAQYGFAALPLYMTEWNLGANNIHIPPAIKQSHARAALCVAGMQRLLDEEMSHTYFYLGPGDEAAALQPGSISNSVSALLLERDGSAVPNPNYNARVSQNSQVIDYQHLTKCRFEPNPKPHKQLRMNVL